MPLHITKIAFRSESVATLRAWLESHEIEARLTTRYLPKRVAQMAGGSLYWIHAHTIVGRSPIREFRENGEGRYWICLEPTLIAVRQKPKRAHQGWRYLSEAEAPPDLAEGEIETDQMPARMMADLGKLGLV